MRTERLKSAYGGKRVFVTGHTGFKGAWLCEWLLQLGADVSGYALQPPTDPSLFEQLGLGKRMRHLQADILDAERLRKEVADFKPDFVFHLAAQSLVRRAYAGPLETFQVNALGTVQVLEALRPLSHRCAAVMITTDKCYENREWLYGYRESDPLGGKDPYSASKAAAEIMIHSWRESFFKDHPVSVASARAGNVIGGGDWAEDRIIPDAVRALHAGKPIPIRNPGATRPWQHVLDPLGGYLVLGAALADPKHPHRTELRGAFNFGPDHRSNRTVRELVEQFLRHWPGKWNDASDPGAPHESRFLHLTSEKAIQLLGWKPVWDFEAAVARTAAWYRGVSEKPGSAKEITAGQLANYLAEMTG